MFVSFSSAGLLYVYLTGYIEGENVFLQQIDSYHYIGDSLYREITAAANTQEEASRVHVFAVVGLKSKVDTVISNLENGIRSNYQCILCEQTISLDTFELDEMGNTFFRCVQKFYCEQPFHFPKRLYLENAGLVIGGICCYDHISSEQGECLIDEVVSLWLEREQPRLCGKQVMTRSFFLRDITNRKVIASLPDAETGIWRLIFEGGHSLCLDNNIHYTKERLQPSDLGAFCSSNIQSILHSNYAYEKWLYPKDIYEEWHKVFLYLCAASDCEWDQGVIGRVYDNFLDFMEENICLWVPCEPLISKELFCGVLLRNICEFRRFLQGGDVPVISKDLLQTLDSRYVYLPYLWPIIEPGGACASLSLDVLHKKVHRALSETDTHRRGTLWEEVTAYILNSIPGWKITGHRIRTAAQEINLSIVNVSKDGELWKLGAYVLVECKNWSVHVDIHQIRNIAHISAMKGNKTALLFASNGITADAEKEIQRLSASNLSIICITANDLLQLGTEEDFSALIMTKWKKLKEAVHIGDIL